MHILTKTLFAAFALTSAAAGTAFAGESSLSDVDSPFRAQSPHQVQRQEHDRRGFTAAAEEMLATGTVMRFQSGIMVEGDTDGDGDVDIIVR